MRIKEGNIKNKVGGVIRLLLVFFLFSSFAAKPVVQIYFQLSGTESEYFETLDGEESEESEEKEIDDLDEDKLFDVLEIMSASSKGKLSIYYKNHLDFSDFAPGVSTPPPEYV